MHTKFEYANVEDCCIKLESCLKRLQAIHDDCEMQINKVKGESIWAGPASESFVERFKSTLTLCRLMETSLENVINYIRNCANNYKNTDSSLESSINQFKI